MSGESIMLQCSCGARHIVDVSQVPMDPRGRVHQLNKPALGVSGSTLQRWAKEGRLRAFQGPRRALLAWEADIRTAVEAEPYRPVVSPTLPVSASSPLKALVERGELEAS